MVDHFMFSVARASKQSVNIHSLMFIKCLGEIQCLDKMGSVELPKQRVLAYKWSFSSFHTWFLREGYPQIMAECSLGEAEITSPDFGSCVCQWFMKWLSTFIGTSWINQELEKDLTIMSSFHRNKIRPTGRSRSCCGIHFIASLLPPSHFWQAHFRPHYPSSSLPHHHFAI
jgi:hypothetical protein